MKYFTFPNLPNDVWLGSIDEPDKCKLVCSCPSDGPVKAVTVAAMLQLDVDLNREEQARHEARHVRRIAVTDENVAACAQAIRDLDRITPRPLTAEDQARVVLCFLANTAYQPGGCV